MYRIYCEGVQSSQGQSVSYLLWVCAEQPRPESVPYLLWGCAEQPRPECIVSIVGVCRAAKARVYRI